MKLLSVIAIVLSFVAAIQAAAVIPECPTSCPYLYNPICGFNGDCYKEHSNDCFLKAAKCKEDIKVLDLEECRKPGIKKC